MKERPIIFNTEMVRAILDGKKTVTRRPIKKPFEVHGNGILTHPIGNERLCPYPCPFGQVGDHLYVREKWRVGAWDEENCEIAVDYAADGFNGTYQDVENWEQFERLWVQSCEDAGKAGLTPCTLGRYSWKKGESPCRWRPSIHMPKWAARIWLEITDIRVERVQDITEDQAVSDGMRFLYDYCFKNVPDFDESLSLKELFQITWDSIYGNWADNPWVWVIEFKRYFR